MGAPRRPAPLTLGSLRAASDKLEAVRQFWADGERQTRAARRGWSSRIGVLDHAVDIAFGTISALEAGCDIAGLSLLGLPVLLGWKQDRPDRFHGSDAKWRLPERGLKEERAQWAARAMSVAPWDGSPPSAGAPVTPPLPTLDPTWDEFLAADWPVHGRFTVLPPLADSSRYRAGRRGPGEWWVTAVLDGRHVRTDRRTQPTPRVSDAGWPHYLLLDVARAMPQGQRRAVRILLIEPSRREGGSKRGGEGDSWVAHHAILPPKGTTGPRILQKQRVTCSYLVHGTEWPEMAVMLGLLLRREGMFSSKEEPRFAKYVERYCLVRAPARMAPRLKGALGRTIRAQAKPQPGGSRVAGDSRDATDRGMVHADLTGSTRSGTFRDFDYDSVAQEPADGPLDAVVGTEVSESREPLLETMASGVEFGARLARRLLDSTFTYPHSPNALDAYLAKTAAGVLDELRRGLPRPRKRRKAAAKPPAP